MAPTPDFRYVVAAGDVVVAAGDVVVAAGDVVVAVVAFACWQFAGSQSSPRVMSLSPSSRLLSGRLL